MICEVIELILRRRSPTPESGNSMKIGLIVYYVCEQNQQRPIDVSEVTGDVRPVVPAGDLWRG